MFDFLSQGRWWDRGLDLVTGCTPVSPGCAHCWSAEKTHRAGCQLNPKIKARYDGLTDASGRFTGEVRPQWDDLAKIGRARQPQVYTFWNDLFHEQIPFKCHALKGEKSFIDEVLLKIIARPKHFYIICTKRPRRALGYFLSRQSDFGNSREVKEILAHRLMIMTTAENQEMADLRLPFLLQIPGVMHGVSVEPGLGLVDLTKWLPHKWACFRCDYRTNDFVGDCTGHCQAPTGYSCDATPCPNCGEFHYWTGSMTSLDWVICGGETGPHARSMHPDIPRKLRDDCVAAGVPYFHKSNGEFQHIRTFDTFQKWVQKASSWIQKGDICLDLAGRICNIGKDFEEAQYPMVTMRRVGKKAAGRRLDDRRWDEVPEV